MMVDFYVIQIRMGKITERDVKDKWWPAVKEALRASGASDQGYYNE